MVASGVAGVDAPAFVERCYELYVRRQAEFDLVSPGLTLRPSLSAAAGRRAAAGG